jgi:EF-hand
LNSIDFENQSFADIFSQISDSNGHMIPQRFTEYLQEVLALPAAVYESPSFSYSDLLETSIFSGVSA